MYIYVHMPVHCQWSVTLCSLTLALVYIETSTTLKISSGLGTINIERRSRAVVVYM